MTEQESPLVGMLARRGWREIIRFQPPTSSALSALVVLRRGRLVGVIPAGGARVLSDYLCWPYEYHEIDTRDRMLIIEQRLPSRNSSYDFLATVRLVYQVERPEAVALAPGDPVAELERVVIQGMRQCSGTLGVEQAKTLEQSLIEMVQYGDTVRQRALELGLAVRRVDAEIALDERASAFATEQRLHTREQPLHLQLAIDSLDDRRGFDVQVGGFFRMTDRPSDVAASDATAAAIRQAMSRALQRVGITFEPADYAAAARAMAQALRTDALLEAELLLAHVQLLRPTVQIQPDRSMVQTPASAQLAALSPALPPAPALALPAPAARQPRRRLIIGEQALELGAAAPWANLAAATGRGLPISVEEEPAFSPTAGAPQPVEAPAGLLLPPDTPAARVDAAAEAALFGPEPPQEEPPALIQHDQTAAPMAAGDELPVLTNYYDGIAEPLAPQPKVVDDEPLADADPSPALADLPEDGARATDELFPAWLVGTRFVELEPQPASTRTTDQEQYQGVDASHDEPDYERGDIPIAPSAAPAPAAGEYIAALTALLHSQGPGWFKTWVLELKDQPERLPEITAELTIDGWLINQAAEPRIQEALLLALDAPPVPPARPAPAPVKPAPVVEQVADDESDMPDWMRLRQKWDGDGGAS
jgi:hypothetical protein